tara:strand:+ start:612 stop:812 length:201 start_codon:yes stop_codon:yes gene_type:complete
MIRVEGHKNLYRDEKSGAIINYDSNGYSQYKKIKSAKLTQKSEIESLRAELDELKLALKELTKKQL